MIKIGDFGISRILQGTMDMASTFTGTPFYMSPEGITIFFNLLVLSYIINSKIPKFKF
jgi:serine/threonine protein kinase